MIERQWIGPPLPDSFGYPDLRGLGDFLIERIRRRTLQGQDASGGAMQPLSPGYAAWKQKVGASLQPLTLSGAMLNGMSVVEVTDRSVTLGFAGGSGGITPTGRTFSQRSRSVSNEQKALYHCVEGAGKSRVIRDFFDLNESDIQAAVAAVDAEIARRLA